MFVRFPCGFFLRHLLLYTNVLFFSSTILVSFLPLTALSLYVGGLTCKYLLLACGPILLILCGALVLNDVNKVTGVVFVELHNRISD